MKKPRKKNPQGRWTAKHHGIVAHARALGVRREHLWMVLEGQRESRSLMARYEELTGRKAR